MAPDNKNITTVPERETLRHRERDIKIITTVPERERHKDIERETH